MSSVTLNQVAQRAGVRYQTVSKVLNCIAQVSKKTVDAFNRLLRGRSTVYRTPIIFVRSNLSKYDIC